MSICTVNIKDNAYISANDLTLGQMGRDRDGNIYLRTNYSLVCLNKVGHSYTSSSTRPAPDGVTVRPLLPGDSVTLTQE